jgi:phosphoenolpyruvate-protein phosphotransferase (PTS system enzyme I)
MSEIRLSGRPASPGLAMGPVVRMRASTARREPSGDPQREAAALRAAIRAAAEAVAKLIAKSEGEAADMLSFQLAMLEDDALSEGAFEAIETGLPADVAWHEALGSEIVGYERSEDDYFRARTADLRDIRDRVAAHLTDTVEPDEIPEGAIIVGEDLAPSRFLAADWSKGGAIVLSAGSPSSHVAMLARARGVPMIVSIGRMPPTREAAMVDGGRGIVVFDPEPATCEAFEAEFVAAARHEEATRLYLKHPAVTASGERVQVMINLADLGDLRGVDPVTCDGIGLTRTEFLFHSSHGLPDEEAQLAVYRQVLEWAGERPVTIRTLDAGGDKPIPGLTYTGDLNPFLGMRGLRLSLARPDVFRVQLRALARAAVFGKLKVMLPMVTVPSELERASAMLDEAVASLQAEGVACRRPPLGIMVEVPAAAISAERFPADFYSIGSNDLTQYTMAAARDFSFVAELNDAGDPAVLHLIERTVAAGRGRGVEVSLCGDAGADVALIPKLLATGLRSISVAPVSVARVKAAIAAWS